MFLGGISHFINPETYNLFIPDFFPKLTVNYFAGILEILTGLGLFVNRFRHMAALAIFVMLIFFYHNILGMYFKKILQ